MGNAAKMILLGVLALVGLAIGGGYGMLRVDELKLKLALAEQERDHAVQSAERLRNMNNAAATKYGKELGRLIMAAGGLASPVPPAAAPAQGQSAPDLPATVATPPVPAAQDAGKLIDEVRAILATRDGLRASLDGVRASINSEFDALAAELGGAAPDAGKLKEILESLKQNWPRKEKDMEAATRRLLVDLGLRQAPAASQPAAVAPAAPPAPAPAAAPPAPAPAAAAAPSAPAAAPPAPAPAPAPAEKK